MKPETIAILRSCLELIKQAILVEHGDIDFYTDFDDIAWGIQELIGRASVDTRK